MTTVIKKKFFTTFLTVTYKKIAINLTDLIYDKVKAKKKKKENQKIKKTFVKM